MSDPPEETGLVHRVAGRAARELGEGTGDLGPLAPCRRHAGRGLSRDDGVELRGRRPRRERVRHRGRRLELTAIDGEEERGLARPRLPRVTVRVVPQSGRVLGAAEPGHRVARTPGCPTQIGERAADVVIQQPEPAAQRLELRVARRTLVELRACLVRASREGQAHGQRDTSGGIGQRRRASRPRECLLSAQLPGTVHGEAVGDRRGQLGAGLIAVVPGAPEQRRGAAAVAVERGAMGLHEVPPRAGRERGGAVAQRVERRGLAG